MYSILASNTNKKTAKRTPTIVKEKEIHLEDYKTTFFKVEQMMDKQTRSVQKEHELFTVDNKKISLSPFNDKKWISRDGDTFKTYSFGHYRIVEEAIEDSLIHF